MVEGRLAQVLNAIAAKTSRLRSQQQCVHELQVCLTAAQHEVEELEAALAAKGKEAQKAAADNRRTK